MCTYNNNVIRCCFIDSRYHAAVVERQNEPFPEKFVKIANEAPIENSKTLIDTFMGAETVWKTEVRCTNFPINFVRGRGVFDTRFSRRSDFNTHQINWFSLIAAQTLIIN